MAVMASAAFAACRRRLQPQSGQSRVRRRDTTVRHLIRRLGVEVALRPLSFREDPFSTIW